MTQKKRNVLTDYSCVFSNAQDNYFITFNVPFAILKQMVINQEPEDLLVFETREADEDQLRIMVIERL